MITLDALRPKAASNSAIALNLAAAAIIENDTLNSFFLPIKATGLNIPNFVVTGITTTASSDVLTTTGGGFANVKVGDTFAAAAGIATGSVIAKTDDNNIRVSVTASASGTISLTFTPIGGGNVDITLIGIEVTLIQAPDGKITVVLIGHTYDGSLQGTPGTGSNSSQKINLNQFNIDLDAILQTARIPRSN